MNLSLKGFSQLVQDMGAALQSSASSLIDVSAGSVVRAIFEANASVALWIQWLILQVLSATRASTSNGTDLDSWMLDFGVIRLPAIASTGIVTFSRFVDIMGATVPAGTIVKTTDGLLSFSVAKDSSLSIWQPGPSAYVLPPGVASVDLPVSCLSSGSTGNVLSGTVTVLATSLPGIDQVNNANPFANGIDAESDQAFRNRFQSFLSSRSRATLTAVQNAITNVQQGVNFTIEENSAPDGTTRIGSFLIVVDDGSGYPSPQLLANIAAAVDLVRPIGTMYAVIAPQVMTVNVSLVVSLSTTTTDALVIPGLANSIAAYLDHLPIGSSASVTRVAQHGYLASAGITNITSIQLNGSSSDITVPRGTVIKAGQVVVTANDG